MIPDHQIRIELYRVKLPLTKPYGLSLGKFDFFDGIVCSAEDSHGNRGWGESIALPGYCNDDADSLWTKTNKIAGNLAGKANFQDQEGFAWSPLLTALEHRLSPDWNLKKIPLVVAIASINGSGDDFFAEMKKLYLQGYRTLKIKVGIAGVETDIAQIRRILREFPKDIKLRLDANQKYSFEDMQRFTELGDFSAIEYFEQPFPKERWDLLDSIASFPFAILLDESVWTEKDLLLAKKKGIEWVKLKLFKHGGPHLNSKLIQKALDLQMKVIWGNGFQAEIGCWHEMILAERFQIPATLECNGYLKLKTSLLARDFHLTGPLSVDVSKLNAACVEKHDYSFDQNRLMENLSEFTGIHCEKV